MGILRSAVLLVIALVAFVLWWEYRYLLPKPGAPEIVREIPTPKEAQVQVRKAADYCAQLGGFDDGGTTFERLASAVAHLNLAKDNKSSTCDEFERFGTLISEGGWTVLPWRRFQEAVYKIAQSSEANKAAYNQLGLDLSSYQTDPTEFLKEYPWFACVTKQIRTTWPGATPWPDKSLREKMKLVFTSSTGAEFFCPKK